MPDKDFDPADWARNRPRQKRGGQPCGTCNNPAVRDAITSILRVWAGGAGEVNWSAMHRAIQEEMGFKVSKTALMHHIRQHERELWEAVNARFV